MSHVTLWGTWKEERLLLSSLLPSSSSKWQGYGDDRWRFIIVLLWRGKGRVLRGFNYEAWCLLTMGNNKPPFLRKYTQPLLLFIPPADPDVIQAAGCSGINLKGQRSRESKGLMRDRRDILCCKHIITMTHQEAHISTSYFIAVSIACLFNS